MDFPAAALGAMNNLLADLEKDPASKRALNAAKSELVGFLDRHQYFGEAAVMVAALTLAKDESDE